VYNGEAVTSWLTMLAGIAFIQNGNPVLRGLKPLSKMEKPQIWRFETFPQNGKTPNYVALKLCKICVNLCFQYQS